MLLFCFGMYFMWGTIGMALVQALFSYLSLILLMLLMAIALDKLLPSISPKFKFLAVLIAVDLFMFGAIGLVYTALNFTQAVALSTQSMAALGGAIGAANLIMGFFAVGYQLRTGEPIMPAEHRPMFG